MRYYCVIMSVIALVLMMEQKCRTKRLLLLLEHLDHDGGDSET